MPKEYDKPYSTPYYDELKERGIRLPCFLTHIRTDECRRIKPTDARMFRMMFLTPRTDGCCGTIDTSSLTNLIMIKTNNNMELTYHEHPTKEQLLEYFSRRIRVRKMTPREAFRLMDADDADIDKMMNAEETITLKNGTTKTRKAISKTACYKLAGNSIVVDVLYYIFRNMFIPEYQSKPKPKIKQLTIFDYL